MDVAKFIRILGYIMYVILWSPVIVLTLLILFIMNITTIGFRNTLIFFKAKLKESHDHDMKFINEGVWEM